MIIDAHRHFMPGKANLDLLQAQMKKDGFTKTVLFGYHGLQLLPEPHQQDKQILNFSRQYPDRIIPFFCDLDFYAEDCPEYVCKCVEQDGFKGLGEILLGHTPIHNLSFENKSMTDDEPIHIFQMMGKYGLPVLFHADPQFAAQSETAISLCPQTNFIWAHAAYNFCGSYGGNGRSPDEIERMLSAHPNLYFDISHWKISPIYLYEPDWLALLSAHSDRFVFGSDMSENYLTESVWVPAYMLILSALGTCEQEKIMGENLLQLIAGI